ncbi:MAG: hypothetical protein HY906_14515, partial [Deltaproteobacteria bacterium]|nr:hypothetical protein [Deltaproteobacteria bacterium]
ADQPVAAARAAREPAGVEARGARRAPAREAARAEAGRKGILGILRQDQARARDNLADVLGKNEEKKREQEPADKDWAAAAGTPKPALEWAKVRVFPVPAYTPGYDGPRTDFRETIYWNPSVKTDQSGKTKVSFFASDAITSFRVTTEGISSGGLAGRNETVIKSKLPFFMEVKLPLEVSTGDRLDLPLTLKNEQQQELPVGVRATFGPTLKALEAPPSGDVKLASGTGVTQFHQLEVGKGTEKVDVSFAAQAQGLKDEFTRTLKVVPTGFPRHESFSGTMTGRVARTFDLKGATEGSITARVTLYPSPMATMLTGLDSILREPYGCFEQASSANYPNIMVVRYMQDRNVARPDVLERSHRLLESGYRKITSFESRNRGYEWFGGDPGHEALTAYGLMEFADMKAVYGSVDSTMVKRTAEWLHSRRDGRGGFIRNPKALDHFGGANQQVTDAYIVFALTEAGMTESANELRAVVQNARASNDPYVVALATRSAFNAKHADAPALARKLAGMQQQDGRFMGTTHSITRSGGLGLAVETTSLAILALLPSKGFHAEIRKAVTWLSGARSGHGGFGSSQATILALKALTAYDLASKQMQAGGEISVLVNGQAVRRLRYEKGREDPLVIDGFGASFKPGPNQVEVRMAGGSPLPFTLAVDYYTADPASSPAAPFKVQTAIAKNTVKMGETVRVTTKLESTSDQGLPMTLVRLGIPGGLSYQNWQLKELVDKKLIDFYETRAREIIFYFRSLPPQGRKEIAVDLVANVPGVYTAPATSTYLYYTAEHKAWAAPLKVQVTRP